MTPAYRQHTSHARAHAFFRTQMHACYHAQSYPPAFSQYTCRYSRGNGEAVEAVPGRRCLKTHAPHHLVPWKGGVTAAGIGGGRRVIVVTRNPNDACVSMFHHSRDVESFAYTGDFQHFINMCVPYILTCLRPRPASTSTPLSPGIPINPG